MRIRYVSVDPGSPKSGRLPFRSALIATSRLSAASRARGNVLRFIRRRQFVLDRSAGSGRRDLHLDDPLDPIETAAIRHHEPTRCAIGDGKRSTGDAEGQQRAVDLGGTEAIAQPVAERTATESGRSPAPAGRGRWQRDTAPARLQRPAGGAVEDGRPIDETNAAGRPSTGGVTRGVADPQPPRGGSIGGAGSPKKVVSGGTPPGGSHREPVKRRTPPASASASCVAPNTVNDARRPPAGEQASACQSESVEDRPWPAARDEQAPSPRGQVDAASGSRINPIQAWIVRTVQDPSERSLPLATQVKPPTSAATVASDRIEARATRRQRRARMASATTAHLPAGGHGQSAASTPWNANNQASPGAPIRSDATRSSPGRRSARRAAGRGPRRSSRTVRRRSAAVHGSVVLTSARPSG